MPWILKVHTGAKLFLILLAIMQNALSLHLENHDFYALESTEVVSDSSSITQMNACKQQCLKMGQYFPFKFKYHRYILRELAGNCLFALKNKQQYYSWKKLKIYVVGTTFSPDMSEVQRWTDYDMKCEDTTMKMDKDTLEALNFKRVHSNFQYFEDGSFKNLEPFTDINQMLSDLKGVIN